MDRAGSLSLFPIGALAKTCGVTRRMLLNYEDHGLLRPAFIQPDSGYRYYNAFSVSRVCHIVDLQRAGFSLLEIGRSLTGDRSVMIRHLEQLRRTQQTVAQQISAVEAYLTAAEDHTVFPDTFPAFDAVCTTWAYDAAQNPYALLQQAAAHALRQGWPVSKLIRRHMLTFCPPRVTVLCAVETPRASSVHFEETRILRMNTRASYRELPEVCEGLLRAAPSFRAEPSGEIRIIFLAEPQSGPEPGSAADRFVMQLFLPVTEKPSEAEKKF